MGKAALIAVAAFAVISTMYTGNTKKGLLKVSERVANHQYDALARSAAVNGFNLAKQALTESFAATRLEGTFDRAAYNVSISVSGDFATVISTANIPNASSDESEYRIRAEFRRRAEAPTMAESAPDFMSFAVMTEDDLRISGNAGAASAYADASMDANFHTNGNLTVDGKGTRRIAGQGTYVSGISGKHADTKFDPVSGGAPTSSTSTVDLPDFDIDQYLDLVSADYSTESTTLSGTYSPGGTRDNPFVYHVDGDLTVGDLTVDGYVLFLVEGDINFTGNARVGASGYGDSDESSMAFYSGDEITMNGSTEVWGQLYSADDFTIGGTADLYGSITSGGELSLKGDPVFHYRQASPALTTIWNGDPGGFQIRMTSFFEK